VRGFSFARTFQIARTPADTSPDGRAGHAIRKSLAR